MQSSDGGNRDRVNIERFSGFAAEYNTFRPSPPAVLARILAAIAAVDRPCLVVDIGSGTGLSTRYWTSTALRIIGVEPNDDMRRQAVAETAEPSIEYISATSDHTTLPDGCADIVTCSQALHWLEPTGTFREVARILRPGGVFAAYDYDWPPTTGSWEADAAFESCLTAIGLKEEEASLPTMPFKWAKHEHLSRMRESGRFRFTKEIVVHHEESGNDARFIGLLLSQGQTMAMLNGGFSESELGIDRFSEVCRRALGPDERVWLWSSRVRIGVV